MAGIKKAADKIRKAGQSNAPSDSILAHITPEEAQMLYMMGGSGETDPETGLPHFEDDDGFGEQNEEEGAQNAFGESASALGGEEAQGESGEPPSSGRERKSLRNFGEGGESERNEGTPSLLPSNMSQEQRLLRQETLVTGAAAHTAEALANAKAAKQAAINSVNYEPTLFEALTPTKVITKAMGSLVAKGLKGAKAFDDSLSEQGLEMGGGENQLGGSTRGTSGDPAGDPAQLASAAPKPVLTPQEEVENLDVFDPFTRAARKKKGLQSTIVSGGSGGSGITMGKTLLGA